MERWTNEDGIQKLFEIFLASQKLILNSLDYHGMRFTRYQFCLMMELSRGRSLTMSQRRPASDVLKSRLPVWFPPWWRAVTLNVFTVKRTGSW